MFSGQMIGIAVVVILLLIVGAYFMMRGKDKTAAVCDDEVAKQAMLEAQAAELELIERGAAEKRKIIDALIEERAKKNPCLQFSSDVAYRTLIDSSTWTDSQRNTAIALITRHTGIDAGWLQSRGNTTLKGILMMSCETIRNLPEYRNLVIISHLDWQQAEIEAARNIVRRHINATENVNGWDADVLSRVLFTRN